ncbi:MurR/RpiR family transcriptional regulator [Bradyrhizobium sp. 62B]|jgi:DNA-binding MurR/RpiR family transcriptional regulator|uniref:MurR/RpiR family transcriptional regulator n=1 Tax=unclassified Bradyrhizobium TaxID=2631580 RepID=UPI0018877F6A|nr:MULTISPECIES: MurR/RpiR family transcriptional regulator [Bradyrhizobium]WIW44056.1 MurR/RpiR family transcriptional regulator [Bradyrhizobium sp. 62B]MBR0702952.1 MurR/RpiR family transcriptional regulator [Bradyrhizobium diazoefficiens]MBR0771707.1 MurR/RpiR family transcriptional regulator [Bradyrhizobium diazoefficiens]MBR0929770.1 MurR/RpiR family transcriptional regulator [Bradyrhizobium diazoefficiens]MDT4741917.1 MurR/RpiR family transcriptional regulator [Bradyrhizobium sp. WYCCWR 
MNKAQGAMSYDELRGAIAQRHRALSGRLQQIAEFVLDHPTDVALGTVAEVAQRSGVPPSAIVRFAHALGFGGFTEMQQVFRSRLVAGVAPSYKARLARMKSEEKSVLGRQPAAVLSRFVSEAQSSLVTLSQSVHARELDAATAILAKARDIYLLGLGGSFPVATHLAYVLRKLGRRVVLLDGTGGSIHEQSHAATVEDALVAISFRNYYPDTARLFPELVARGVPTISITDSLLSPIVEGARVVFEIQDMPEPALRTLVAPMCLVQAMAIGLDLAAD